jgi:Acyltransferase
VDRDAQLCRIHLQGRDNVPAKGGALLVPNHVSMVDAVLLIASIDRPIRFLMFKGSYDHPLVKPFAKIMGVIPISSQLRPREMIQSYRMSRFSKIGGEMVPHIKIEDKLHELSGATEQTVAVTAVPDEKKGEQLIVLHTLAEDKLDACLALLAKSDLPALWKPRGDQFVHVDWLPYLGTVKLDLRRLKEIATEKTPV